MNNNQKIQVCLIIPVYNEAASLGQVLVEALTLPPQPTYELEILVVDGGSSDGTAEVAARMGVKVVQQRGRGYGAACYTGYEEAADADILVYLDGDYSDPPAAIPALLEKMLASNADLALGSRTLGKLERGALPVHAVWGNRLIVGIIGLLYQHKFSDLPSLKAIRREKLTHLQMQEMTYGWTTEMLVKAARAGCKIVEGPVNYRKRAGGKSKVSGTVGGTVKAAYHLLKVTFRYVNWKAAK